MRESRETRPFANDDTDAASDVSLNTFASERIEDQELKTLLKHWRAPGASAA